MIISSFQITFFLFFWAGRKIQFNCKKHAKIHPTLDVAVINLPKGRRFQGGAFKKIKLGLPQMSPKEGRVGIVAGWGTYGAKQEETADRLQVLAT